jgi:hypothetical protein
MQKKLIGACLVIAAFAALPSLASAKPVLTHPTGMVLAVNTPITATNVGNTTLVTPNGTLTCSTAKMTGKLTVNSTNSGIEGDIESATFSGTGSAGHGGLNECTGSGLVTNAVPTATKLPWCIEATTATDEFEVRGGACTAAATELTFDLFATDPFFGTTIECKYFRPKTEPVKGTFQTDTAGTDAELSIANQKFSEEPGNPGACPSSGNLNMTFTLETDTVATSPMYISS